MQVGGLTHTEATNAFERPASPGSTPFLLDETLPPIDGLGDCERRGCGKLAIDLNDEQEALCLDHLTEWALGTAP